MRQESPGSHPVGLSAPLQRKPFQQIIQPQLCRLPAVEDRLYDSRRPQREPENAADDRGGLRTLQSYQLKLV
jgi:hypothetical protein